MRAALLCTALIFLCCGAAYSQSLTGKAALTLPPEKANPVKAVLFAKPPVIDGKLDDEVWQTAVVLKD